MSIINKITVSCLVLGLAFSVATAAGAQVRRRVVDGAQANVNNENAENAKQIEKTSEEGAIIFRIEDIKPLTNEKTGLIDKCSFMVTVFNRMDVEIQEATLDFLWRDTIAKKYKIADDDVKAVASPEEAITLITKTVTIDKIKPHRQKSFAEVVETDKCFLLFDQLEYQIKSCIAEGDKIVIRNNQKIGSGSCGNRFDYINSKNPEYYSEFKDTPESVLQQQAEEEKEAELEGVNKAYDGVLAVIEKIDAELDKIAKVEKPEENAEDNKKDAEAKEKEQPKEAGYNNESDKNKTLQTKGSKEAGYSNK
ncbi:MAG: hypothetical protein IJ770_00575 [Alphaproteobacteria bacterium]|nr:hypothetical protein [Alphaproteobacteria bacterium]